MKKFNMKKIKVRVEVSARHVHLCQTDLEKLFGAGYKLKPVKELSQEGEFAAEEKVILVGSKRQTELRVVGPVRRATQVELAYTDAFSLGIDAPLRISGDVVGSGKGKLIGPVGEVELSEGIIVPKRHLHINPKEAQEIGVKNNDIVKVAILGERGLIFDNVVVRVKDNYRMSVHLDTDEANAAGLGRTEGVGELIIGD
jgi:putative phosphotransacetylase